MGLVGIEAELEAVAWTDVSLKGRMMKKKKRKLIKNRGTKGVFIRNGGKVVNPVCQGRDRKRRRKALFVNPAGRQANFLRDT